MRLMKKNITNQYQKEKNLSVKQISLRLHNIYLIARRVWKIQICMLINFISSKDTGETRTIYVWIGNVKIMWGSNTDDIINELFESLLKNYQEKLKIIS